MVDNSGQLARGGAFTASTSALVATFIFYAVQTAPMHFFHIALPIVLRESGADMTMIALTMIIFLPWSIKIFWAGLVDRYPLGDGTPFRNWVLLTHFLAASGCFALAWVSPVSSFGLMIAFGTFVAAMCATQDIAVDGWASAIFRGNQASGGATVQAVGSSVGAVAGGAIMLVFFAKGGWPAMCYALAATILFSSIAVRLMPKLERAHIPQRISALKRTWHLMQERQTRWIFALTCVVRSPASLVLIVLQPALVDLGADTSELITFNIFQTMGASAAGALLSGLMLRHFNMQIIVCFALITFVVCSFALYASVDAGSLYWTKWAVTGWWFVGSFGLVLMYQVFLRATNPHHGGFDFTFFVSIDILLAVLLSPISGFIAETLGVQNLALSVACLSVILIPVGFKIASRPAALAFHGAARKDQLRDSQ